MDLIGAFHNVLNRIEAIVSSHFGSEVDTDIHTAINEGRQQVDQLAQLAVSDVKADARTVAGDIANLATEAAAPTHPDAPPTA